MYVFLATCTAGVGNCGRSGTCEGGKCVCTNDWTGIQCEIPPEGPKSPKTDGSKIPIADVPKSPSADGPNFTCTAESDDCGRSGTCEVGKCVCTNDWTGAQCETPPEAPSVQDPIAPRRTPFLPSNSTDSIDVVVDDSSSDSAGYIIGIPVAIGVFAIAALVFITKRSRQKQREEIGSIFFDETQDAPLTPTEGITTF